VVRAQTFVVSATLGTERFDTQRAARARLRAVVAELRRLRRGDDRLLRIERTRSESVAGSEVHLTIVAPSPWQAFDLGSAMLRAAIHAIGDSTAGWERIEAQMMTGGRPVAWARPTTWADAAMMTARSLSTMPPLPPIAGVPASVAVIDLR
jgi:hypothetical protein